MKNRMFFGRRHGTHLRGAVLTPFSSYGGSVEMTALLLTCGIVAIWAMLEGTIRLLRSPAAPTVRRRR